ncbi:dynamin family protein [Nocardioides salsibiostraticola]
MAEPTRSPAVERALATAGQGRAAANAYGRPDLAQRIERSVQRLLDPQFHVLVVGEFKQGKSTLVNALVGQEVCPVDDDISTAVPTALRWSAAPTADVIRTQADVSGDERPAPERVRIEFAGLDGYVVEGGAGYAANITSIEVGIPSDVLRDGMILIDTPGVGGLGSAHGAITVGALPMAEAVVFVTDAGQEFTASEMEFLTLARSMCPNLVCVLSKTDFYPSWRKIRDLNAAHLAARGIDAEILAVSSDVHRQARETGDEVLDRESGIPAVLEHLRVDVLGRAQDLAIAAVARDLHHVTDQLEAHFTSIADALDNPAKIEAKKAQMLATKEHADELKSRSARWQTTLNDGVSDLNTEVDHDLRLRFRNINLETDKALDVTDPAETWAEFEPWLYRRAAQDLVGNYQFLQGRARALVEEVDGHFERGSESLDLALDPRDATAAIESAGVNADLDVSKDSAVTQAMSGVKSTYYGMLMFGALGAMANLALGPIPIGIGLLMGRKQVRDERERQLVARRGQARNSQRKYLDEVSFHASKDSRDSLRRIHRLVRDHFTIRAEEQSVTINEMLQGLQSAARADAEGRAKQSADVKAELGRIAGLRAQVDLVGTR